MFALINQPFRSGTWHSFLLNRSLRGISSMSWMWEVNSPMMDEHTLHLAEGEKPPVDKLRGGEEV